MAETKFTPGPWQVLRMSDGVLISTPDVTIGEAFRSELEPDRIPTAANAALIAAAPDLYAALEALLNDQLEYERANRLNQPDGYNWVSQKNAADVLRKARGE